MRNILTVIVLGALLSHVQAQHLYQCGNTFSQVPCGEDAKVIKAPGVFQPPTTPVSPERVEAMKAACSEWLRIVPSWKDRDSLKILSVTRGKFAVERIRDVPTVVVTYYAKINGKNSYGAYAGEKIAVCYANEQETKILDGMTF